MAPGTVAAAAPAAVAAGGLTSGGVPVRGGGSGVLPGDAAAGGRVAEGAGLGGNGVVTDGTLDPPKPGFGGRVMRTVSLLTSVPPSTLDLGGSEMRTVSFLGCVSSADVSGSAMADY